MQLFLESGVKSIIFDHFNSCLKMLLDLVMEMLKEGVVAGWLLRKEGIDIRNSTKFGS